MRTMACVMSCSRWDQDIKFSAVYGHVASFGGCPLASALELKVGKSIVQSDDVISGKREAKEGRGIVASTPW